MTGKKVLIVDDEKLIVKGLRFSLEQDGMKVDCAYDGEEALEKARANQYDIILLDIMLPKLTGFEVCQQIREFSDVPVIMLTAKGDDMDKILGLEYGADDYITKPFENKELIARVKAVLRRTSTQEEKTDMLSFPGLTVSLAQYEVYYDGQQVDMPPKELEVLYFLASHVNQVFTRDQLLERVWGFNFIGESSRTVDVHIKRLREKLPECERHGWMIRTIWGVGYKFEVK